MSSIYTHSNVQFAVSAAAYDSDLNLAGFQGVASWINVANVGSLPERGINTNMLSYDTVNTLVTKKAKGITDAGTGTLECARDENDPGQAKMTAIGQPNYFKSHAFEMIKQEARSSTGAVWFRAQLPQAAVMRTSTCPTTPSPSSKRP